MFYKTLLKNCAFIFSPAQVEGIVKNMLGNRLVTKQTSKDGVKVNKVQHYYSYAQKAFCFLLL